MSYSFIIEQINTNYALLRQKAEFKAEKTLSDLLAQNERFKDSYYKIKTLEKDLAFLELKKDEITAENLRKELKTEKEIFSKLLKELNVDIASLVPNYACKRCKDTGFVNGKRCSCYNKYLSYFTLKKLEISKKKLHKFSDDTLKKDEKLEKAYIKCKNFCEKFPTSPIKNLVFTGQTGTGKTFLAEAIASEIQNRGFSVIYLSAFELNKLFTKYHTNFDSERTFYLEILTSCDMLVVDDLGAENTIRNVTEEYLVTVLSERMRNNLTTLVTTNLTLDEIKNRYGERFFSRLFDKNVTISFRGKDLRIKK